MLCQNCGENEANVRYTQIINGEKKEMMLCNKCWEEIGIEHIDINMPIDFSSFFGSFLGESNDQDFIPMLAKPKELKCGFCNMTYNQFIKNGKLGCANCYVEFENKIDPLLKRIHGENRYLGRKAKISNLNNIKANFNAKEPEEKNELEKLQNNLKQAIKEERYEDAAKIRDEIKRKEGDSK